MTDTDGLSSPQVENLRRGSGWNEVAETKRHWMLELLTRFWGPSAWMIEAIALLSFILSHMADAGIALALLVLNAVIGFWQEQRAEKVVEILKQRLRIQARVLRDKQWKMLPARELVPQDVVHVRMGDFVPADMQIIEGETQIDQSQMTGESAEVGKAVGDTIYSGSLVRRGACTGKVTAIGAKTYFGRTIQLVQTAKPKLHLDEIAGKLMRWLFMAVGLAVIAAVSMALMRGSGWAEILPLSLVLLMSAVPVALPVMFSVSTAVAASALSKKDVLVTRLSAAEDAAMMSVLCVDKTGTLTQNKLSVAKLIPADGVSEEELLTGAALASNAADQDAIDNAILQAAGARHLALSDWHQDSYAPFSPQTRRTEAVVNAQGKKLTVSKGGISAIAAWAGFDPAAAKQQAEELAVLGLRSIAVAQKSADNAFRYMGIIALEDPPRPDSKSLIERLRELGIRIVMLTGDARPVAQAIATQVGLNEIAPDAPDADKNQLADLLAHYDGLARVYPETKFNVIGAFQSQGKIVGMTGDGVNDAPSLKRAEVGIAVSSATDAAKAAASVVLTTEGLSGIIDLVENGRAVYQRLLTWVVNKISRTALKAGFVVSAYFITGHFVISAMAILLLTLMTDFAKISLATDHARISRSPDSWNVGALALVGGVLGFLMVAEALGLLLFGIHYLTIAPESPQVQTYSFFILMFMGIFSILSIRERKRFWSSKPSGWLCLALAGEATLGLAIGMSGFIGLAALPFKAIGAAIGGSAIFSLIVNDYIKYALLNRIGTIHLLQWLTAHTGWDRKLHKTS
ncbi:MAG: plasma-membrane proton-efflux P-type ATPase [Pseudomonadota bacterium]|nr:plasma-membrane proton-efflux P-type ATPase [Pseudomonadota bacterium]MDE3037164.1 plasma-membrane proton-efflux P-type ATPase [Pseudomonadota bacterium]